VRIICALHRHERLVRRVQRFIFLTSTTECTNRRFLKLTLTEWPLASRSDFELIADFRARAIDRVRGKLEHARRLQ